MNTEYLICILTSSNIKSLEISLNSALNQKFNDSFDVFIVVNTLNDYYYEEVLSYYRNYSIVNKWKKLKKIIRTESNGKPGMGHNSLINIFREHHNYDKLVILDGDDLLYPESLNSLDLIYKNSSPAPDIINLAGNTKLIFNSHKMKSSVYRENENKSKYSLTLDYDIEEIYVSNISKDYNDILATPTRPISLNRKILNELSSAGEFTRDLYDNECVIYDDYKIFLICYKEYFSKNPRFNVQFISCTSLYIYSKLNVNSVCNQKQIYDEQICKNIMKELSIDKLRCENIKLIPYNFILNGYKKSDFYYNTLINSIGCIEINTVKRILFIDNTNWSYNTINEKPLGGTQSAIYYLSNQSQLYNKYNVCVLTKNSEAGEHIINKHLKYNTLTDENIKDFNPDIVIFQGQIYNNIDFYDNINENIKLFIWQQHDFNVNFVKKKYTDMDTNNKINYIFVSNWQKNRFIQQYNLDYEKCHVIQNAISDKINLDLPILKNKHDKTKTLVYMSSPYRGLLIAYELFKQIKQIIPDVKLKVFSCFNRDFNDKYISSKKVPLPIKNKNSFQVNNELDKFYKPLYDLLINDQNIEYYGSVPQNVVFEHLNDSMILFYPNTYPETCCTSILEAMAHRCNVITSDLGALPETSNGFASLYNPIIDVLDFNYSADTAVIEPISIDKVSKTYVKDIVNKTVYILNNYYSEQNQKLLNNQLNYIKNKCVWKNKIIELDNIFQK